MRARLAKSRKQPVLNSVYLSNFNDMTEQILKESKPFTTYHRDTQEYEVVPELCQNIPQQPDEVIDERVQYPVFQRRHEGKYGYQEDAVDFANVSDNVLLNFPQGMGKSLTTMKIILDQHFERVLVVCGQSNLQEEWLKDAVKHRLKESLAMEIIGGDTGAGNSKRVKWLQEKGNKPGVDLINIESLRNDVIVSALNQRKYQCVVVDEVQSAKGWKAAQTEGLHEIIRTPGQMRIALSGTPVLNSPLEFFSMLKYFGQLKDTARTTFEKYYGNWSFDFWGHYVCTGHRNLNDLNELMKPVVCAVDKAELGLPAKTRHVVRLDWVNRGQFNELKRVYKLSAARLKRAGYTSKPQVKAEMQYLSSTADPKKAYVYETSLTQKVLVFSQYTTVLEEYRQHLENLGRKVLFYHGALSMNERLAVLDKWRTGEYDVLLLSIMAARYGLNLTEATNVIFLDVPPSLAVLEQAEDRSHRIGQNQEVHSHILVCSELDEQAWKNMNAKQSSLNELNDLRDND